MWWCWWAASPWPWSRCALSVVMNLKKQTRCCRSSQSAALTRYPPNLPTYSPSASIHTYIHISKLFICFCAEYLVFVLQLSSDEAVRRVLSGEKTELKTKASTSRSQDKENREGRELNLEKEVSIHSPVKLSGSSILILMWFTVVAVCLFMTGQEKDYST